jgi:hypothetical protein|nr:MAG TPA: hypothetical protein [Caudoviricetes sp.]
MKLHRFLKSYCLVLALMCAVLTVIDALHRNYLMAIAMLVCTFANHLCYDYHKNKIDQYENEKEDSENPSQTGR